MFILFQRILPRINFVKYASRDEKPEKISYILYYIKESSSSDVTSLIKDIHTYLITLRFMSCVSFSVFLLEYFVLSESVRQLFLVKA
jgi:hypothetical protein